MCFHNANYVDRDVLSRRRIDRNSLMDRLTQLSDRDCRDQLRMGVDAFAKLCRLFRDTGRLGDTLHSSIEEKVARFLLIISHYWKNRTVRFFFMRSGETVSRHFHQVLEALISLEDHFIKQLDGAQTPLEIETNPRFWPYLKDCVGAIDGSHIRAKVSEHDVKRYRGRKEHPTQNVLAACTFDLRICYILAGWEGSASDSRILNSAIAKQIDPLVVPRVLVVYVEDMITAFSRSNGSLGRRQRCPCGEDQCYINVDVDEEQTVAEPVGPAESNFTLGRNHAPPEMAAVVPSPYVGQSFESDDEALEFYATFARNNGFSVRRERSKGNPEHPMGVYKRELVCHRAGPPLPRKTEDVKRQRNRKASRCKCEAQMVIKKNVSSGVARWVVVNFNNVHNHELMDSNDVRYPPSYRNISGADRDRILALAKSGCTESVIMRTLEMEKGVRPGQLAFNERDLRNFLQSSKSINREGEGSELLKVCRAVKEKNPDFRYEFTLDANNKLEHVVWSYASSVRAYKLFGDVVVFDTYHLNAYDRPVGVWFGIDNHGHPIFFGCTILLDEKPESIGWALQSFLRLMDGKLPQTILTDIDMPLKDAILTEIPNIKHAFPVWHVMPKLSSWFSVTLGSQFEKFKSEFDKVYELETLEEFELGWNQMVTEFGISSDRHITLLYSHRSYWALSYLQGWFFGGLLTSGHSLSIKSFFKGFLDSQTRLKDFVEQVGVAVDFQNQAEEEATTRQNQQDIKIKTCMPIEEHASTILTPYAFDMFQKEIMASTHYAVFETARENYLVRHHLKVDGGHVVSCMNEEVHCSCKGFKSSGILCKHALRVLSLKNCFLIPENYLLTRWRRESSLFPKSSGQKFRSQALRSLASIIIQESAATRDRFEYVEWHLSRLLNHVRDMPSIDEATADLEPGPLFDAPVDIVTAPSITRGRPRKVKGIVKATKELQA